MSSYRYSQSEYESVRYAAGDRRSSERSSVDRYSSSERYQSLDRFGSAERHNQDGAKEFEKGRIQVLQEERVFIQKKTFTKWCNSFLEKVRPLHDALK
jgi:spectrin beta